MPVLPEENNGGRMLSSIIIPRRHPIPHARLGNDLPGVGGVIPQLAAQPLHHVPQQPTLAHPLGTPHPLQQQTVVQHQGSVHHRLTATATRRRAQLTINPPKA